MYTTLIFCLAGMVISIVKNAPYFSILENGLFSMLGAVVGTGIGFAVSLALPMITSEKTYSLEIESLSDNSGVSGSFFLGSGYVGKNMCYVFYYRDGDGFRMRQVKHTCAKIKYTEEQPRANVTELVATESLWNLFAIDLNIGQKEYVIEVPRGSIKNNYTLDSQ